MSSLKTRPNNLEDSRQWLLTNWTTIIDALSRAISNAISKLRLSE